MLNQNLFMETLREVKEIVRTAAEPLTKEEMLGYFSEMELSEEQKNMVINYLLAQDEEPVSATEEEPAKEEETEVPFEEVEESKVFKMFMEEVEGLKTYKPEELSMMYVKLLQGDKAVITLISEAWMKRVVEIARKENANRFSLEDIIQEGNMGLIKAEDEFMETLRVLCDEYGSLLIFDEVMSGFRVAYKGAQSLFNVKPDLITYAKIIGGGLPCGVYGGRREIMEKLSPLGGVYQAGTMSGNPVVMAAGLATLNILKENKEIYDHIDKIGKKLQNGIEEIAREKGISLTVNRVGGMMTIFFTDRNPVRTYDDAKSCDLDMFRKYFLHMMKNGFNIPQSQFESMFLSAVHTEEHIDKFLEAFKKL